MENTTKNKSIIESLRDEIILDVINNNSTFKYREESMIGYSNVIEFREDKDNERYHYNIKIVLESNGTIRAFYRFFSNITGKVKIEWIRILKLDTNEIIKEAKNNLVSEVNIIFNKILL